MTLWMNVFKHNNRGYCHYQTALWFLSWHPLKNLQNKILLKKINSYEMKIKLRIIVFVWCDSPITNKALHVDNWFNVNIVTFRQPRGFFLRIRFWQRNDDQGLAYRQLTSRINKSYCHQKALWFFFLLLGVQWINWSIRY